MDPRALLALLSLADRAASAFSAFQAVRIAAEAAKAQGRDLTLDDLKKYEIQDDEAKDLLVQAINDAES